MQKASFLQSIRPQESGCWHWKDAKSNDYPRVRVNGSVKLVSREVWELYNGPIPSGLLVCHKCDNTRCVNPTHLFLGTHKENTQDMIAKGRQVKRPRRCDDNIAVLVRLSPDVKALLEKAKDEQRRSMASIVEEAVKTHLTPRYAPVNDRLNRFLGGK